MAYSANRQTQKSATKFIAKAAVAIPAVVLFLCSVAGMAIAFRPSLNDEILANGPDLLFFYASFNASQHFGSLFDLQTFAFGQAFGSFQHPTLLHPFYWIFDLSKSIVLSYYFTVIALWVGTLAYCRALGLSIFCGILCGTAACTGFFNVHYLVDVFGGVGVQFVAQIAIAYLGMAAITAFAARSMFGTMLGFVVLGWSVLMDWLYAGFFLPFVVIGLMVCAYYVTGGRRALLVGSALFGFLVLYLGGVYHAYDEFSLMSTRLWGPSIYDNMQPWLLVLGGLPAMPFSQQFGPVAAVGILLRIIIWRPRLSALALLTALFLAVLAYFELDAGGPHVYWTLPRLNYFERPFIPLYVIFLVSTAGDLLHQCLRVLRSRLFDRSLGAVRNGWIQSVKMPSLSWPSNLPAVGAIVLAIPVALVLVIGPPDSAKWRNQVTRLPRYWAISEAFVKQLQLHVENSNDFSPYFFDATPGSKVVNCLQLEKLPLVAFSRYCGDMMNVFSAREYAAFHNLLDLQNYAMLGQAWLLIQPRVGEQLYSSFEPLKSFGIRYVAVDGRIQGGKHLLLGEKGDKEVSLVDLGPIGPSDLSVNSVKYDARYDVQEVIAARRAGTAIVHDPAIASLGALMPVAGASFRYGPDQFSISAESSGNSALLLPFQFSSCLSVIGGDGAARLIRVNGAQAALRFNTHVKVDIVNDFRFFGDTRCRYLDFTDAMKLGLWPRQTYEQITEGRRVPILMRLMLKHGIRQRDALLAVVRTH